MWNIPGITKEELEAAKKIAMEDMKKDDRDQSNNTKPRRTSKKTSKSK